jgi:hypothetical protein
MKTDTGSSISPTRRRVLDWPGTRLGWWAWGLAVLFFILMMFNGLVLMRMPENAALNAFVLPFYGIIMLACGIAAGVVGLLAMIKGHERSILVWFPVIFGLFVLLLLLGEFLLSQ